MDYPRRFQRFSGSIPAGEHRRPAEKDRDRLLYSHAFLRLAGVTQVSSTTNPGKHHYRLAHSVKVAQVGAALARTFIKEYGTTVPNVGDLIDPVVVEAAGLAHDIGHPPTGHNGEKTIDTWSRKYVGEPFEGNAQTFRILRYLGDRTFDDPGFGLTRATLLASAKYPWSSTDPKAAETGKFGYYEEDGHVFRWAAQDTQAEIGVPTLEAQLMDWADDITYAIHDTQDYYRSGQLPLDQLFKPGSDLAKEYAQHLWTKLQNDAKLRSEYGGIGYLDSLVGLSTESPDADAFMNEVSNRLSKLGDLFVGLAVRGPYVGSYEQRCILVGGAAHLLGRLIEGPTEALSRLPFVVKHRDNAWFLVPDDLMRLDILLLKGLLFWRVVPGLANEQNAETQQITALLDRLYAILRGSIQWQLHGELAEVRQRFGELTERAQARYVIDLVAGLADAEFKAFHSLYCAAESGGDVQAAANGAAIPPWPFDQDD